MGDDLQSNLDSYYLQLQQVDAALTTDPANEELLKLKNDLQEVIDLTKELLTQTQSLPSGDHGDAERGREGWKVGDKCLAPWSQDSKYYEAVIEEIQADGKVSVGFTAYAHGDVTHISALKSLNAAASSTGKKDTSGSSTAAKRVAPKETLAERKAALLKQKEYLKKRKIKKQARVQEQEAEREKDKKKWINFSAKKGLLKGKKSIFASPETVDGRVGIGTCGVSGKPMTEFSQADKWKRGWKK